MTMKTRTMRHRLGQKTTRSLLVNHLCQRYRFSPAVAESLTNDLETLLLGREEQAPLAEGQVLYPAVRAEEPAGKPLKDCQYTMVRLTLFPRDDLAFAQQHSLHELKKHVLARLSAEADAQGAPLTYEDLARLLFADRKTIGQFVRELRAERVSVVTRASYTDASASVSHHRPIVRLFLLNYTETQIAQRTHHTLSRVEAYLRDFLRVAIAHRQGYGPAAIRHLLGLGQRVVDKHLAHYQELAASPVWQGRLEPKVRFYETALHTPAGQKGGRS
jgi:hypothetical protein